MKKKKLNIKKILFILCLFAIIIFVIKIIPFHKSKLVGTWTSDGITVYEFYSNNKGKLIVSLSEYEFYYELKANNLYIDFVNKKSEDSKYSYTLKNNQLVLKNEKGIFTFTKK